MRAFLGLTGYYRKFIPDYAEIATPLTDLTRKNAPNRVKWSEECERALGSLKRRLCSEPILKSPDFDKEFVLQTDASEREPMRRQWDGASSSILQQEAPTPRVEILHNRKGMPRHQSCHTYVPCLSLGKEVHHSDRSPCIGVAGPSKGQQCPPHPVEPSTAAIPVCCPISSWLCQQQCRLTSLELSPTTPRLHRQRRREECEGLRHL